MSEAGEDPFAQLLAAARASAKASENSWLGSQYGSEDGAGMLSPATRWNEVVRLLEALSVAARVSRALHKDCVALPSRDITHYYNVDTLHGLLMQQLLSLETGLLVRQERASAVPTRPLAIATPMGVPVPGILSPEEIALRRAQEAALPRLPQPRPGEDWSKPRNELLDQEEEQGWTCIIT